MKPNSALSWLGLLLLLALAFPAGARATADLDGDSKGDLVWRHDRTGDVEAWLLDGLTVRHTSVVATVLDQGWQMIGSGDLDGDRKADLIWVYLPTQQVGAWLMNSTVLRQAALIDTQPALGWVVAGIGDVDGDRKADLVRHNTATGDLAIRLMNGLSIRQEAVIATVSDRGWRIVGVGDVDGDGKGDLVWHHALTGELGVWLMNGVVVRGAAVVTTVADLGWNFVGVGDVDGDGKADVVGRHATTGDVGLWLLNGFALPAHSIVARVDEPGWQLRAVRDVDGDAKGDLMWYHQPTGQFGVWLMDGEVARQGAVLATVADLGWRLQPEAPPRGAPLTPGEPRGGEIAALGESGLFEFWLDAPARVVVQATRRAGGVNPCVEVYTGTPAQLVAGGAACATDKSGKFVRVDLTLATGTYAVVVRDSGDNDEGNYNVLMLPVTDTASVPLGAGEPLLSTLDRVGDINLYQFTLDAATRVVVEATRWPGVNGVSPCLEVYTGNPAQPVPGATTCAENTAPGRVAHLDLGLAPGTYFVAVHDAGQDDKGKYHVVLLPLTAATSTALSPGVPQASAISVVGDVNLHGFALDEPTRVIFQVLRTSGGTSGVNPCLQVYSGEPAQPAGGETCAGNTAQGRVARLDLTVPAGTHFVAVRDAGGDHKGDYTVLMLPVTAAASTSLAVGVPQAAGLGGVGEVDLYQFSLASPARVQVLVERTGKESRVNPCLEVYAGVPAQPVPGGAVCASTAFSGKIAQVDVVLPAGTYFAAVRDAADDDVGDYTVVVTATSP